MTSIVGCFLIGRRRQAPNPCLVTPDDATLAVDCICPKRCQCITGSKKKKKKKERNVMLPFQTPGNDKNDMLSEAATVLSTEDCSELKTRGMCGATG